MSKLSGIKDVDREILSKLDDKELLKTCSINKYTWNTVCDDAFLRRRLTIKYPKIEQYKKKEESWKSFFLKAIHYIALMKEKFDYEYTFGNFVSQYNLLKKYNYRVQKKKYDYLLIIFASAGELALTIWCLNKGVKINTKNDALISASILGHLEVVKYLVEKGVDVNTQSSAALRFASQYGKLEVVKYLLENGADIHSRNDEALILASQNGHLDVVRYLVENGADVHAQTDAALSWAVEFGYLEVENYLKK
jgi:hypothetical protein